MEAKQRLAEVVAEIARIEAIDQKRRLFRDEADDLRQLCRERERLSCILQKAGRSLR